MTKGTPMRTLLLTCAIALTLSPVWGERTRIGGSSPGTLSVDTIGERTAASGVTIDGALIKDSIVTFQQQWVDFTGAGAETMTAAESKFGFITVDTAKTINLVAAPVAGMTFTILVTADVVVTIDGAGEDVWMDGSTDSSDPEDIVNSGSAGECISLFWDGTAWRAHHVEGSWTI